MTSQDIDNLLQYDLLSANEQIILVTACLEKQVTNERLQPLFEALHPVEIGKNLAKLVENGFLKRQGSGRGVVYCLGNEPSKQLSLPFIDVPANQDPSVQVPRIQDASVQDASVQDANILFLLQLLGNGTLSSAELLKKSLKKSQDNLYKQYLKQERP